MTDELNFADEGKPQISSGLNVLTILTYIGSGIGILFMMGYSWLMNFSKAAIDKALSSGQEFSAKQLDDMTKSKHAIEVALNNVVPIVIIGLVGCILCIVGATMMRKLKKDGFWIYTAGEILPVIGTFILVGTSQFTGVMSYVLSLGLPVLFVALYAMRLKEMK